MSTLFSHFFEKINQISPLESNFTEVLSTIALKPKTLYFYGKLPENMSKNGSMGTTEVAKNNPQKAQEINRNGSFVPTEVVNNNSQKAPQFSAQNNYFSACKRPKCVAIVGARRNTAYGEEVAYKLAYALAKRGVVIVSGLAYGIDSIAHRACLDASGTTVAVLGTPIDHIYPTRHQKLALEILEQGGAILSEYPPICKNGPVRVSGSAGELEISSPEQLTLEQFPLAPGESISASGQRQMEHKASFLYRNRLISGLSDVVVIAEAASHSGSLNTAAHALEQGREVFAVPGNITAPFSQGCNRLLAQGAMPYTEPDDILRLLFLEDYLKRQRKLKQQKLFGDTPEETAILKAMASGLRRGEEIMQKAILPPNLFNQAITMLEIKSRVRSLGANNWALN